MAVKPMEGPPTEDVEQDISEWFRAHSGRLLCYFQWKLGNRSDAEDMLQATMLKAIKTYDPARGPFEAWVWRVAASQLADMGRRIRVRKNLLSLSSSGECGNIKRGGDPEQQLSWIECRIALDRLSKQQCIALLLNRLYGWTHSKIAQRLHISEKRVSALIIDAIALLEGELSLGAIPDEASNIDHDAYKWDAYVTPPNRIVQAAINNVRYPSRDGKALRVAIAGGDPYTNIHAYHTLPPLPTATAFRLSLWWRFSHTTFANEGIPSSIQAIELSFSKWFAGSRFEWACQWMNVSDGTAEQAPTWRLWTGAAWLDTCAHQRLAPEHWHYFALEGNITVDRQVRYVTFISDKLSISLGQTFAPVPGTGDKVTIALQLDGNYSANPYECIFDHVCLEWFTTAG